jgi:dTDP-glucose 4,6-dehydratase
MTLRKRLLVTGGAGFIGSNFIRLVLSQHTDVRVVNLDALTYAGNLESLTDVVSSHGPGGDSRYRFVHGDIRDFGAMSSLLAEDIDREPFDAVVHFAAESHVDRSIMGPRVFVDTNVTGTLTMLEATRAELTRRPRDFRFVHVSTDEVYGSLGPTDPAFTEMTPLAPNSPYAASKAASDLIVRSYPETFGLPAIITRCSNNYGPFQFPEKLIPLMITRAIRDERLPLYGDGMQVRDWIHVTDHAEAVWAVLQLGEPGRVYNIGGKAERANLGVVKELLRLLVKPESLIQFVTDRLGHDRRYAMNNARIQDELGWAPRYTFEQGLAETVRWYQTNRNWWERVLSEAYRTANALYLNAGRES